MILTPVYELAKKGWLAKQMANDGEPKMGSWGKIDVGEKNGQDWRRNNRFLLSGDAMRDSEGAKGEG